jgi:hypothetical protein
MLYDVDNMFYIDLGYLTLDVRKTYCEYFLTFRKLWDSKKGKFREHSSQISYYPTSQIRES